MRGALTRWLRARTGALAGVPRRQPSWTRWVKGMLGVVVVGLSAYYLWRSIALNMDQFDWHSLQLRPGLLFASIGLTCLCVALGGTVWQLLLAAFGQAIPLETCLSIHTASNLAKYLPGYAWQVMSKAYLTRREEVPPGIIGLAMGLDFGCLLATGLVVAMLAMPPQATLPLIGAPPYWTRMTVAAVLALALVALPRLLVLWGRYASARGLIGAAKAPRASRLWAAVAVMALAWILFGLGLGCIVQLVHPLTWAEWPIVLYALTSSFVVSLLAVFVPGGLGVREGVMAYALGTCLPGGLAAVSAVLSRLVLTLSEVLTFALVWAWRTLRRRRNQSITRKN